MRKYKIAIASKRYDAAYKNQEMDWQTFLSKISQPVITKETQAEYSQLPKKKQDAIKDVGGFVAGYLRDGKRSNLNVHSRSMITLDIDFGSADFIDRAREKLPCTWALYSTHKHRPEKPKYRLIIPLSRDVSPEEYEPLARKIAEPFGMNLFDDTTYQPARLMYWPSCSIDGEYVFEEQEGPALDPDAVLSEYVDWSDATAWPVSDRVPAARSRAMKKQGDPLEKTGIIGAYCRAHFPIQDLIESELSEIYAPGAAGRYTYVAGHTSNGVVIYDDRFAYSNHGTDPASQQLCNAFDLMRIHKFQDLDEDAEPGTPVVKLPSYQAMMAEATKDRATKVELNRAQQEALQSEFADLTQSADKPPKAQQRALKEAQEGDSESEDWTWTADLEVNKKGLNEQTIANVVLILQKDQRLKGIGGYDEFHDQCYKSGSLPWWEYQPGRTSWSDADDAGLRYYMEKYYQISNIQKIRDGLSIVLQERKYHPVRDWLNCLPEWDGVRRVDTLMIDYHGVNDTEYARVVTRKAIVALVKRVFEPGCKFDNVLTLVGPKQGTGKSTTFRILGGEWFNDTFSTVTGKEAYEALAGSWVIEMAEMSATRKADIEAQKQFISKSSDRYRKAYARNVTDNPRQCVFFGTTNDTEFLRDYSGNRRYWPLLVGEQPVTKSVWTDLEKERDQIFAEALELYRAGEDIEYLGRELEESAREAQEEFRFKGSKEEIIAGYLERKITEDWYTRDIGSRAEFIEDGEEGTVERTRVCAEEIWCEALGGRRNMMPNADMREIHLILSNLGWVRNKSKIRGDKFYGRRRYFLKQ